jgi:hypothetical protein
MPDTMAPSEARPFTVIIVVNTVVSKLHESTTKTLDVDGDSTFPLPTSMFTPWIKYGTNAVTTNNKQKNETAVMVNGSFSAIDTPEVDLKPPFSMSFWMIAVDVTQLTILFSLEPYVPSSTNNRWRCVLDGSLRIDMFYSQELIINAQTR